MVTYDDIYDAYLLTRNNKRRSADSVEFELHAESNIANLVDAINTRTLQPSAYTFVAPRPKPREVFASALQMRIVHHYIDTRIRPFIEDEMSERSFNNRVGKGTTAAIYQLNKDVRELTDRYRKPAMLIKLDLTGYFPNALQDVVYQQLVDITKRRYNGKDKDDILYMIMVCTYSYPTKHCYRKSPIWKWEDINREKSLFSKGEGVGGAIGFLFWQIAMNFYLNKIDLWIIGFETIRYVRFVDDMYFVVPYEEYREFLSFLMPELRKRLAEVGCTLNEKKFYCQDARKSYSTLGTVTNCGREYLSDRIIRNGRKAILNLNKCVRFNKSEVFMCTINSYLGMCNSHLEHKNAERMLALVNKSWWKYCKYNENKGVVNLRSDFWEPKLKKYGFIKQKQERKR